MKNTPEELKEAFDLLHEYNSGTFTLYKTGDMEYGENWEALFRVGYGKKEYVGSADSPAKAIKLAVAQIPHSSLWDENSPEAKNYRERYGE